MKTLFDQTALSEIKLKNRLIRSATYDKFANDHGHMTKELFEVYKKLAQGGVGTIITGGASVTAQLLPQQMGIYEDSFIDEYKEMTDMAHSYHTNIILQIVDLGSQTRVNTSQLVIGGPSPIEDLAYKTIPKEMTKQEILLVQDAFANAALRAKKAGFDGVQLHVAHGFLLSKFLTPYYNRRIDEYGGTIENRARITLETYKAMREKVGSEYPILIKINCEDFMDQGMTLEECKYVCKELAELGINAIEISGGSPSSRPNEGAIRIIKPQQESYFKSYAAEIAQEINVPVILVGGNRDFDLLTKILNQTSIEYIALCRPLLCESNLVNRWQSGSVECSKCVSCNKCFASEGTSCIFNRYDNSGTK